MPPQLWLRLGILAALLISGVLLIAVTPVGELFTQEKMIELLDRLRNSPTTPLLLIGLFTATAPLGFPSSPLLVSGGIVFGALWGTIYNLLGLLMGSMSAYYVARFLGREFVERIAGPKLRRAERLFQREGFWPLVQVRFLPIPLSLVSYGAALSGIRPGRFFLASALGLLPATVVHTYFAPKLILSPTPSTFGWYVFWMILMNLITGWPSVRERFKRRRRYRELMAKRQSRWG